MQYREEVSDIRQLILASVGLRRQCSSQIVWASQAVPQLHLPDASGDPSPFRKICLTKSWLEIGLSAQLTRFTSLDSRSTPANVIVQRLTAGSPHDRLSKAIRHLGRIMKTTYILRYITDRDLRDRVQRQLNKGEYRQKLSRWIFFAQQGEFTTGDYVEIMSKASCLSLMSNAILYWNTVKIGENVDHLRANGEPVDEEELSHVSLLSFRQVMASGSYFIEDHRGDSWPKTYGPEPDRVASSVGSNAHAGPIWLLERSRASVLLSRHFRISSRTNGSIISSSGNEQGSMKG